MNQTDAEEPTALTKALRALCKVLRHQPNPELKASAVNEQSQSTRR